MFISFYVVVCLLVCLIVVCCLVVDCYLRLFGVCWFDDCCRLWFVSLIVLLLLFALLVVWLDSRLVYLLCLLVVVVCVAICLCWCFMVGLLCYGLRELVICLRWFVVYCRVVMQLISCLICLCWCGLRQRALLCGDLLRSVSCLNCLLAVVCLCFVWLFLFEGWFALFSGYVVETSCLVFGGCCLEV